MALIELEKEEIELIKRALSKRQEICKTNLDFYNKHYKEIEIIFSRLEKCFIDLTPNQRAIITGCIKDFIEYANNELLRLTDYEIFKIKRQHVDQINQTDTALILFRKLKDKSLPKRPTIKSIIQDIDKIVGTEKVYYSILNDGKIYKVAIMVSENQGLRTRMEGVLLENFKIEKINRDSYMHADKPNVIVERIRKYGENNILTRNHERVIQLLSYNSNSKFDNEIK